MNELLTHWYDEDNILQVSGSLYRYFGIDRGHGSDPDVDAYLNSHKPRCIIALLIDALGSSLLDMHAQEDGFFRSHRVKNVSTVYPPTTTAATTAFLTGRSPAENGWLGWHQYFEEERDNIILFRNTGYYSERAYPYGMAEQKLPIAKIYDALNSAGIPAEDVWPGWAPHNPCVTFHDLLMRTKEVSRDHRFVYAYWDDLDTFLHVHGTACEETGKEILNLQDEVQRFAEALPEDTVLLVIADHSQIDVRNCPLYEYRDLMDCLRIPPALEQRTVAFYLKNGTEERFRSLFHTYFGDSFLLLTKPEVITSGIFGPGIPSPRFEEFIGDMTAFALTPLELDCKPGVTPKGNHAGMVRGERYVPVILYRTEKK